MFFENKKTRLEKERDAFRLALRERRFGDARKHGEAAYALAAELGDPTHQVEAAEAVGAACISLTDWVPAEEIWVRTAAALRKSPGLPSPSTMLAHVRLVETLVLREKFEQAIELVRSYAPSTYHGDDLAAAADAPLILSRLGRHEEAFELAKKLFNREVETRDPRRAVRAARCFAEVLVRGDRDLELAVRMMLDVLQRTSITDEVSLLMRLRCDATLCEAQLKRGNINEAAATARGILAGVTRLPKPTLRATVVAQLRLQALEADAFAALGQLDDAKRLYQWAVRHVETTLKTPRDPVLIELLDGLARVLRRRGEEKDAETQERRARAIRLQVTGKSESELPAQAPAVHQLWPRRTLAGIFAIRGVNLAALDVILRQTMASYQGPRLSGFDVVRPDEHGQAFLVVREFSKAWDPAIAVACKHVLGGLDAAIQAVNAGIALSAGGHAAPKITVAPWFAVADFIQCEWWTWPAEERERIKREVFPRLPGWVGPVEEHYAWLGLGVRQEGTTLVVTPNARMDFIARKGIGFAAMGPPELIDAWFFELALATSWFPGGTYEPLAPQQLAAPVAQA